MSSIDERIVKMTFDNGSFEKGINTTIKSLEKLNEVLKNTGNTDAVNNISKSMKDIKSQLSTFNLDELTKITQKETIWQKFGNALSTAGKGLMNLFGKLDIGGSVEKVASSFSKATEGSNGLSASVETVSSKFSALGVIGATALMNITNRAVDAGARLAKALTIEPITTGFSEYETKVNAISTILANTADEGKTIDDVTKALNELNEYSDQTIYNFAQMTDNIGKFTAAGVGLEDSVAAIKGMSNLAAYFGVDATKAAGAMYQMSQALSAGKVQLMDWRSLINAGMSGEAFQDALIRTSELMGTGAKAMIEKYGSFNESLTKGEWLTADVMLETLKQISGAYKESELRAQGYSATQAKAIVDMANRANKAATEVRTITGMLDAMKESVQSGWAISWEHIIGDKEQATELLTNIKNGFDALIKPSTEARNNMLQFWNEAGGRDAAIRGFTNIFQSLGKGMKAVGKAWKEVFPSMTGEKLTELSTKFRDLTYKFKMTDETAQKIKNTFKGVFDVFKTVGTSVWDIVKSFSPLLQSFPTIGDIALSVTSGIGKFASGLSEAITKSQVFEKVGSAIKGTFEGIGTVFEKVRTGVSDFFGSLGEIDISKIFSGIGKFVNPFGEVFKTLGEGLGKAIGTIDFNAIMKALQTASGLKVAQHLVNIFKEVGGIGESVKEITKSFSGMFKSFGQIGKDISETLGTAKEALEAWQQDLQAGTLLKIAGAVGVLAASLILISTINGKQLAVGLSGIYGVLLGIVGVYAAIGKVGGVRGMMSVNGFLVSMAISLTLLSAALKLLSTISIGEMVTGLFGLMALLVAMNGMVKVFDGKHKGLSQTAKSLVILAIALSGMAVALRLLGTIDAETMGSGLFALALVLGELAAFLAVAKFGKLSTNTASAILILSGALLILAQATKQFGKMETDTLIQGLVGIAAVLAEMAVFNKLGGGGLKMASLAVGIAAMGAALHVMASAVKSFGGIQWDEMGRGLTAMAGALVILGVATKLISGPQMLLLSVGLAAMGVSLHILASALQSFGGMTWEQLGIGLVGLAGSLTVLAVAMYAMTGCLAGAAAMLVMAGALALFVPQLILLSQLSLQQVGIGLLALAGALAVVGAAGYLITGALPGLLGFAASIALFGAGAAMAGAGMALFGTGFAAVAAAVGGSGFLIIEFIRQLIGLLPQIGLKAGEAMVNFAGAVSQGAPQIIAAFSTLLQAILTAIQQNIPLIAQTGMDIVLAFAKTLADGIPQLVTYGMQMVTGILEGIAANIGQLVDAGIDVCVNFIDGVSARLGEIIESGINLALSFIEGVADGISNNKDRLEAAIEKVIQAMVDAGLAILQGGIDGFVSGGEDLANGLIDGIVSLVTGVSEAAGRLVDAAIEGVGDCGKALYSAGENLVKGFTNGIESALSWVGEKARKIATAAKNAAEKALGINSPSKVFMEIGRFTDEGFAVGLTKYAKYVNKSADDLANGVIDRMSTPMGTISPVVDLSSTKRQLANMQITGVTGTLANSIGKIQNGNDNSDIISALKDLKDGLSDNRPSYNINGITYDDGSNVVNAVETLVRAARIERRI